MQQKEPLIDISKSDKIVFGAYGVEICIRSENKKLFSQILERLPDVFPAELDLVAEREADFEFFIKEIKSGFYKVYRNGELLPSDDKTAEFLTDFLLNQIRLTVAEYADSKVFMHAGVVGWKGKAIIIPGKSFSGKTTLVSELIKQGAEYYSDEYAVLDADGFVHPFPKTLSVRGILGKFQQKEMSSAEFGAAAGTKPIPGGMVLLTEFEKNSRWDPKILTTGQGVLESLIHTLPIKVKPEFTLKVLYKTLNRCVIAKGVRGEASETANLVLKTFKKRRI